jgi:phosphoribosylformylglycinamidine synthase
VTINSSMGLGFDDQDLDFYTKIFQEQLGRDPTNVEIYDLAQSNSEHSRHWFFGGRMVIDGVEMDTTLFKMVKATLPKDGPSNSIIAFHDNSSAIRAAAPISCLKPVCPGVPSPLVPTETLLHPILTAETHNFPCAVAPFPGAETGTGGRLRDVQATGRGAHTVAGISSYCFGNLQLEGYDLPWEDKSFEYPSHLATPQKIAVEASNGASDYGNKYGEPVVHGFCRSFGLQRPGPNPERVEWIKPIMFSAGIGQLDDRHTAKNAAEAGMLVVKVGGPAYRIGMGGGAASSRVNNEASSKLDFNAVQRGDAEMENRMNRLVRACIEMGDRNPIVSIHDQGCGGNGNVLKEIVEEKGADYDIRKIELGDPTLSVCEIWGAEYQENNALLLRPEDAEAFKEMAKRENCPICIVGTVSDSGRVTVRDSADDSTAVDLPLELVLGDLPPKVFNLARVAPILEPLDLPEDLLVSAALDRVLRLVSVASKRWLVHKVDRSVTGLIAQQQCVGALQLPLSNCAVVAQSHFTRQAIASACGEQPIKGLLDPSAMARLTVAEMVTNLMWARLTSLADVKASGNWMWAAKLEGEGARVWDACAALHDAFVEIGASIDGGKDSLSMAAGVGSETIKAPGMLTLTAYCTCPDLTLTVTPDLKKPGSSTLILIDLDVNGKCRLGGSSLAHVYGQLGDECPDLEDMSLLVRTFESVQSLMEERLILAGHDRSDGGLITTLMEMAFAGNCGFDLDVGSATHSDPVPLLFNEEIGVVLEVEQEKAEQVLARLTEAQVPARLIGR